MDDGIEGCWGVEGGNIFVVGIVMLSKGVLRGEFKFDFVSKVYFFKGFVFVDVVGNYFVDLFGF